ncbi:MAG: CPBP family intramembrane metalloprotease [Flavobacteriales bacterium]|nr:CPBP family intramembrane metalloprotease [Flavobacteriales bacterium]
MDWLEVKLAYIIACSCFWIIYAILKYKKDPKAFKNWGFRIDNFISVLKLISPFAIGAMSLCLILGYFLNTAHLSWHILPLLLLYPLWGTIQHFLLIGLFTGNLLDMKSAKLNPWIIALLTGILFSAVHFPDRELMLGTFCLAIFYAWVYSKKRNLYVLGIFHGWLGALFYYTLTPRDPFLEVFGQFLQ